MFPAALPPFVPPHFGLKLVSESWERDAAMRLRAYVFCHEQRLFEGSDRDLLDDSATTIVAVDYVMGMSHRVVGAVRIHEEAPGLWHGSRLAIDPAYRAVYGLGSGLVYRAVTTARARGCERFLASVQRRNVPFFRRLAWEELEELTLFGHAHTLMSADLAHYPPAPDETSVSLIASRRAS